MFIILLTYKKSLAEIDQYLEAHRAFLDEGYRLDYFLVSGPQNPRTGGVILSGLKDHHQLRKILAADPFFCHDVADYELIEFEPVKCHPRLASVVNG